jgi:hypothetical protein
MKHAHRTDCLFIVAAILPAVLMAAGYPDAAFILFCPLLIVACIHLVYEQKMDRVNANPLRDSSGVPGQNSQLTLSD